MLIFVPKACRSLFIYHLLADILLLCSFPIVGIFYYPILGSLVLKCIFLNFRIQSLLHPYLDPHLASPIQPLLLPF